MQGGGGGGDGGEGGGPRNVPPPSLIRVNIFSAKGDILSMSHICFYEAHIS